jgi:hypothetical protein
MQNWKNEAVFDVINLALAGCLMLSPLLFRFADVVLASRNAWICGAAIALASLAAIFAYSEWEGWANLALGAWLAISPWILGFHATVLAAMRTDLAIGIAVIVFAAGSLWARRHMPPHVTA